MTNNNVQIQGITVPQNIEGVTTAEEFIAYTARVSNPKNQKNSATAQRLVKYLIKERHWSPFEMVHVCIEINTTRDIARQMLRHRSFSFQEFSQRYADVTTLGETAFTYRECRLQDTKNRQNSLELRPGEAEDVETEWKEIQKVIIDDTIDQYEWALKNGIAKEQARAILPEGLTKSRLYMSGTLRSWIHFCGLRMGNGTQKEHAEIAEECWEVLREEFPNIIEAVEESFLEEISETELKLMELIEDGLVEFKDDASADRVYKLLGWAQTRIDKSE